MVAGFGLLLTVAIYYAVQALYKRKPNGLWSPLVVTPIVVIGVLLASGISYADYDASATLLTDMLQPATVAFAVPLYRYFGVLRKYAAALFAGVIAGSAMSIASTLVFAAAFRLDPMLTGSLVPHSVTTPIAIDITQSYGGSAALTASVVMLTGVFGSIAGPTVIRICGIRDNIARGVMLGTSAHGAGIAKAFEIGEDAGTAASLAMIFAAIFTLIIAPWLLI